MKVKGSTLLFSLGAIVIALGLPLLTPVSDLHVQIVNAQDSISDPNGGVQERSREPEGSKSDGQGNPAPRLPEPLSSRGDKDVVLASNDLTPLQALLNLYQMLIFVLLGVLGLVIGAAYFSLKSISRSNAEEMAEDAVLRHVNDSRAFDRRLEQVVDKRVETKIEEFRDQVTALQNAFANLDATNEGSEEDDLEIEEPDYRPGGD